MENITKTLINEYIDKLGEEHLKNNLNSALNFIEERKILTIVCNEGIHPLINVNLRGEVFIASKGNLNFSSQETVEAEIKDILVNVAKKLKSASWKKIYLVPFGPAVLSMNIKMLVYKILYVETTDILHLGDGIHVDIDINTRDISFSSEK